MVRNPIAKRRSGVRLLRVSAWVVAGLAAALTAAWAQDEEFQQPMEDFEPQQQEPPQQKQRICCRIGKGRPRWTSPGQCTEFGGVFLQDRACRRRRRPSGFRRFGERILEELLRPRDDGQPRARYGEIYPGGIIPTWRPTEYVKPEEALSGPDGRRGSELSRDEAVSAFARIIPNYLEPEMDLRVDLALAAKIGGTLGPGGRESAPETEKWAVSYPLSYEGIPLAKFTRVLGLALADGEIQWIRARNVPYDVDRLRPTVDANRATSFVRRALMRRLKSRDRGRMRMGKPELEIFTGDDGLGRLAWAFVVRIARQPVPIARKYWISAVERPRLLYSENLVFRAVSGRVTGTVWRIGSGDHTAKVSLPYVTVRGPGNKTTSDAKGMFRLGTDEGEVRAYLAGRFVEVNNEAGAPMRASGPANSSRAELAFDATSEAEIAQVSAYYWTVKMLEFFAPILDAKAKQLAHVEINVNKTGRPCNAYYDYFGIDAGTLHYFRSGDKEKAPYWQRGKLRTKRSRCGNTALPSIIGHEMGHALHHAYGAGRGFENERLSEAIADAIAVLAFRTPCIGPNLVPGRCIRYANDNVSWNSVRQNRHDPYAAAPIVAGFAWELVRQLERKYGDRDRAFEVAADLFLGMVKLDPATIPLVVCTVMEVDDDDTVKKNGSPHFNQIVAAARSRRLPAPSTARQREDKCPQVHPIGW